MEPVKQSATFKITIVQIHKHIAYMFQTLALCPACFLSLAVSVWGSLAQDHLLRECKPVSSFFLNPWNFPPLSTQSLFSPITPVLHIHVAMS